ncbi:dTMP kinase [Abditibacterium utsteinense]|uniref:Thymidylate kinase n=1 Tax=Abditibacterium utsteinense TaxID=1960156 RepID=A0A2S8SRD9_9BACT|nr:dTMP kinase [Abditibacterium utsteinense]PQV63357.1 dTMP kinase [Abditibacterium utsteinense]
MFISFEGIDGCGKTTQLQKMKVELEARGLEVVCTREPGGTALAEALREILLHSENEVDKRSELLLFGASRAQHVAEIVRPALHRGAYVLCDRFIDSSEAYQGGGLGLDRDFIRQMNDFATQQLRPARTFLFDLEAPIALERRQNQKGDRIEARGLEFQNQVRASYLEIAAREPKRIAVIDAMRTPDEIAAQLLQILSL